MKSLALSLAALVPMAPAAPAAPAVDTSGIEISFSKDVYIPGEVAYLTVSAAPGTLVWFGFDTDPGPTTIPGIGEFDLGFSSSFLSTTNPLVIPVEGSLELSWVCSNPCENPITGTDIYIQAVAVDPITMEICLSNSDVLNVEDLFGECATEGCTPGYWKNHTNQWAPTGYAPGDDFDTVFGVDYFQPDQTLLEAMNPSDNWTLGAHAVAALLNAAHPGSNYSLLPNEVIAKMQEAAAGDDATQHAIKDELDHLNNTGCPF